MRPEKVISGGQTGADRGALRAAKALGIPTGGWMPKGFLTEHGRSPWMFHKYDMTPHPSAGYAPRTKQNIADADLTIIFGSIRSAGSRLTYQIACASGKPVIVNPDVTQLIQLAPVAVVNVAGNRESANRGLDSYVYRILIEAWGTPEEYERLILQNPSARWPDPMPTLISWV